MSLRRETVERCDLCGADLAKCSKRMSLRDPYRISGETFAYCLCPGCDTWVQNPRPTLDELPRFYDEGFWDDEQNASSLRRLANRLRDLHLYLSEVRWALAKLPRNGCYLDYAAGDGQVVRQIAVRRPDLEVYATEFAPQSRARVARILPEGRVAADLSTLPSDLRFAAITAFGVIEHVPSPRALLRALRERLADDGMLMLMAPNPESWQCAWSGRRWWNWLAPRHMYLMNMATLRRVLEEEGFRPVEEKHFLMRYAPATLVGSFLPSFSPARANALRLALLPFLFYAALPLEWIAAQFGRGGFMAVAAVKAKSGE